MDSVGEGESGEIWENSIEYAIQYIYISYISIIYEMNRQSRFNAEYRMLGASALV